MQNKHESQNQKRKSPEEASKIDIMADYKRLRETPVAQSIATPSSSNPDPSYLNLVLREVKSMRSELQEVQKSQQIIHEQIKMLYHNIAKLQDNDKLEKLEEKISLLQSNSPSIPAEQDTEHFSESSSRSQPNSILNSDPNPDPTVLQEKVRGRWKGIEYPEHFVNVKFHGLDCLVKRTNDTEYTPFTIDGEHFTVEYEEERIKCRIKENKIEKWRVEFAIEGENFLEFTINKPPIPVIRTIFMRLGEPDIE